MAARQPAAASVNECAAHALVVLAAGDSRRLGEPKQQLRRNGETLLHRAVRIGQLTVPALSVVVLGTHHVQHATLLDDLPHRCVVNPSPAAGLAGSLYAAAPLVTRYARVLVLLTDQPALDVDHLQQLLAGAERADSGCAATRLQGLPGVPAVVPGHWFGTLATAPAEGGFRRRLRALPSHTLCLLSNAALERDIDTPADLADARAQGLLDP